MTRRPSRPTQLLFSASSDAPSFVPSSSGAPASRVKTLAPTKSRSDLDSREPASSYRFGSLMKEQGEGSLEPSPGPVPAIDKPVLEQHSLFVY